MPPIVTDLWGQEIVAPTEHAIGEKGKRRETKPNGYAAPPGTGPAGETCKTCAFYALRRMGNTYRKCQLMHAHWTGGAATDIRARSPACMHWRKERVDCPACKGRGYRWDLPQISKYGGHPPCDACGTTGVQFPTTTP